MSTEPTGAPTEFHLGLFERRLFDRLFGFQGGKLQNDCAAIGAEADAALRAARQRAEAAEALAADLQAERNAAYSNGLERAAMVCEALAFYEDDPAGYARQCAAAIRSLKTQEPV